VSNFRTPLRRARGLGSAHHGVAHFIGQRVSAAALILLVLWGVFSALTLARGDYAAATIWLRSPVNATLAAVLVGTGFFHMQIGMREIIEDYIAVPGTKAVLMILNVFTCWLIGALAIVCLLKVALGGGAY
jgi:succinate dehydrogenase / fumarate reductase, membrane anchor subunit